MKLSHLLKRKLSTLGLSAAMLTAMFGPRTAQANPYASCITVTNGTVSFYLNESGGSVAVTYEDGTLNSTYDGVSSGATNVAAGLHTFALGTNTSYTITCHKTGTGTPFEINSTAGPYAAYGTPRGVDVNKNPQNGSTFGRIYVGSAGNGGTGSAFRGHGIYMLSPDMSTNLAPGGGSNAVAGGVWSAAIAAGSTSAPYKIPVG
jgi:hypothetical protein